MKSVRDWIHPAILSMRAYHVPEAGGMIKLDAMENPYTWPQELKDQWLHALSTVSVNRYPDPSAYALRQRLRTVMNIPDDIAIMFGNGSDELIQIIALALARPDRTFLAPEPGFVMYRLISQVVNTKFCGVLLNADDFALDRDTFLKTIDQYQPAVIFIAYPNNPTGNLFDRDVMLEIIRTAPGLVVIDEAYYAFAGESFVEHLGQFENLLIMRTLSKSGLAGLRLGYLLGSRSWLDELEKIRLPYNINTLTQKSAEFILTHHDVLNDQAYRIRAARTELQTQLAALEGVRAWPSAANFVLFRVPEGKGDSIFTGLKDRRILIKNLHGQHPLLRDCLRVTVGTAEENAAFIAALKPSMSSA